MKKIDDYEKIDSDMINYFLKLDNPKLLVQSIKLTSEYERLLEDGIPYEEIVSFLETDIRLYEHKCGANIFLDSWWKKLDIPLSDFLSFAMLHTYNMAKIQTHITRDDEYEVNVKALEFANILFLKKQKQIEGESLKLFMDNK